MFLKKNDFEITDMDILQKYYSNIQNEELDVSLTKDRSDSEPKTAVPASNIEASPAEN